MYREIPLYGFIEKHSSVNNIVCTNFKNGLSIHDAENVTVSNCVFKSEKEGSRGIFFDSVLKNIMINNCLFDTVNMFISFPATLTDHGNTVFLNGCHFIARSPELPYAYNPVFIKGVMTHVDFVDCKFETDGFDQEDEKNAVFFYFDSTRQSNIYWSFDNCMF